MKKFQNYYRSAIVNNKDNVKEMKKAVMATLLHCSSTDKAPNHSKCPKGKESWCFYNRAKALKKKPGSHATEVHNSILPHISKEMKPIYERMSENGLLERLSIGATTNGNECLHSVIWKHCPKHLFCSRSTVQAGAAKAIAEFNVGAQNLINIMEDVGLHVTEKTCKVVEKIDAKRVKGAQKASQLTTQRKRLFQKRIKESESASQRKAEGNLYESGAY